MGPDGQPSEYSPRFRDKAFGAGPNLGALFFGIATGFTPSHDHPPARPGLRTFERYRIRKSPLLTSTGPRMHPQSHFMWLIGACVQSVTTIFSALTPFRSRVRA